jgi:hypothetical protein
MTGPADIATRVVIPQTLERRSAEPRTDSQIVSARLFGVNSLRGAWTDGTLFLWLIAIGFWVWTHPFLGISGDANLYVGRALADLDPAGVGRDMAFVYDGQSRFTIFPKILAHLIATFGTAPTAYGLALASIAAWIAALALLARQFVSWRLASVVVLSAALISASYGDVNCFYYSEVVAVPRPFAEALVLIALATIAAGRTVYAVPLLVLASLLHPIMALPGWAVLAVVLCVEDWRWRLAAGLGLLVIGAAALFGLPMFDRLTAVMDPSLKAFAIYRSGHLFPSLWGAGVLGHIFVAMTTILIAAHFFTDRRRTILLATIVVGLGGIAAQILLGDKLSLLLIIQAQVWRSAWLLAAMGAAMLGVASVKLWQDGPRSHIVLAALLTAWLLNDHPLETAMICGVALALQFGGELITTPISWKAARLTWIATSSLALVISIRYLIGYRALLSHIPAEIYFPGEYFWVERYLAFFVIAGFLFLLFRQTPSRPVWMTEAVAALVLAFVALRYFDARPPFQKLMDEGHHPPALEALIAGRPGDVLWIDGMTEAWLLTGRPQWASRQQGLGTIFSRDLTLQWRARMEFLMQQGLADPGALLATSAPPAKDFARITVAGIHNLCMRPDAPAWVVARVIDGQSIPAALRPRYWTPPVPNFELSEEPDTFLWHRIGSYAVLHCAGAQGQIREKP